MADFVLRRTCGVLADRLVREASEVWSRDPDLMPEAIEKLEHAWALARDPATAVQLSTMYDRVNRNKDALVVLREAFRGHPRDALVRHHAAITLLRHGGGVEIKDFFGEVLKIDADDAFARFIGALLDNYDDWVTGLAASVEAKRDGRQPFLFSIPVWGPSFSDYFVRYFCSALLAPENLPALAQRHAVHFAIFTTEETEAALRADPGFSRLQAHATIHFVRYAHTMVSYKTAMDQSYGGIRVPGAHEPLAFYYARNCKFALMSCAHYVALAAGRISNALVSCVVADTILNDGALRRMADLMEQADAVLVHSVQLPGRIVRPILDGELRRPDGSLVIPSERCGQLIAEHMPDANFVDAERCLDPPLRIAWRVGRDGVLVHANHYHPLCLRPAAFAHPLHLSIDPIDSRFIDRSSLKMERIRAVQDTSIVGMSIDDDPILESSATSIGRISVPVFARWLWGYWGRLRGPLFRLPVRFGTAADPEQWRRREEEGRAMVEAIVARAGHLEEGNEARKSWRLPSHAP